MAMNHRNPWGMPNTKAVPFYKQNGQIKTGTGHKYVIDLLNFQVCHVVRLVIQIDAIVHPSTIGGRHFEYCQSRGKLHSPVAVWILTR